MGTFILFLTLSRHDAITSQQVAGFSSQATCQAAGDTIAADLLRHVKGEALLTLELVKFSCVEVK